MFQLWEEMLHLGRYALISIKILSFLGVLFICVGSFSFGVRCFYFEGDAILGGCFWGSLRGNAPILMV